MVDTDTFLTVLYVMADDFCKCQSRPEGTPGLRASLTGSKVVTLVVFSQWGRFRSERDFYTLCRQPTSVSFPDAPPPEPVQPADPAPLRNPGGLLPSPRIQYGAGSGGLAARTALPLEVLDSSGVPTRSAKRRGAGWLAGKADIGWSNRLGWYEGFHLLLAFGQSRGRHHRLQLCPSQRQRPDLGRRLLRHPAYSPSQAAHLGEPARGWYVVDKGFAGQRWRDCYGAWVICPPKRNSRNPWPKELRRWLAGMGQMVETVFDKLHHAFRLDWERPHRLEGFQTRVAAKAALHNFCIWLNRQLGRPSSAFADLLAW